MAKQNKNKHKKQLKPDRIQTLSNQENITRLKSRLTQFFGERKKRQEQLTPVKDPVIEAGRILVIFLTISMLISWVAFSERLNHIVPSWLSQLFFLALAINILSRFYWFIFIPDDRKWLRYRGFIDWIVISVIIFFYFYGTGLYYVTLDVISTKILPFVSQKVNELLTNLFGWIMSGLLGNAAYDGIKWIYKRRKKVEQS